MKLECTRTQLFIWSFACFVLGMAFHALVVTAHASPSDCNLVNDNDTRHQCRAMAEHNESECNLISNNDERRLCRAWATERR
jgi:hypothetical protein